MRGLVLPAIASALYLFVLPKPAQWVYRHWRRNQKITNDIRLEYEDQQLLTIEESRAYRARVRDIQQQLDASQNEVETLKNDLRSADAEARKKYLGDDNNGEPEQWRLKYEELRELLDSQEALTSGKAQRDSKDLLWPQSHEVNLGIDNTYRILRAMEKDGTGSSREQLTDPMMLETLMAFSGRDGVTPELLRQTMGPERSVRRVNDVLSQLVNRKLVSHKQIVVNGMPITVYGLTQRGKALAVAAEEARVQLVQRTQAPPKPPGAG